MIIHRFGPRARFLFCCVLILAVNTGYGQNPAPFTRLDAWQDYLNLPFFQNGVTMHQVSSYDRNGYNNDGGSQSAGTSSYLYVENSKYVLLDEKGPGCVYRMWFTFMPQANIQFFFDGETTPRIDLPLQDFFSGKVAPFLFPLAGDDRVSSGGFYCYHPFPYRQSLKIVVTAFPSYYNITYGRFGTDEGVLSYSDPSVYASYRELMLKAGQPLISGGSLQLLQESFSLESKQNKVFNLNGPSTIYGIEFRLLTQLEGQELIDWCDEMWLTVTFDDHLSADIDAPFTLFFGGGIEATTCKALFIGSHPQYRTFYCYFPMPFRRTARLTVARRYGGQSGYLEAKIYHMPASGSTMLTPAEYLHTSFKEGDVVGGMDFNMLTATGSGMVVGCVMDMVKGETIKPRYLEGDERVYVDGSKTPSLQGTGTEDFFNGGNYFSSGNFSLPLHGMPLGDARDGNRVIAYRLFLSDRVPFYRSILFGMEHGDFNNQPATYKTLVFWYGSEIVRLTATDSLDVAQAGDEGLHTYQINGTSSPVANSFYYEGDQDNVLITDSGRRSRGQISFNIKIADENGGVKLRRRLNAQIANQQADVYVDGIRVGIWYDAGQNSAKSWRDSDFEIASRYTHGRSQLQIRLDTQSSAVEWSDYRYGIYSYAPGAGDSTTIKPCLTAVSKNNWTGVVGQSLDEPITVRIEDGLGAALPGFPVSFEIVAGDGHLAASQDTQRTVQTDKNGLAGITWILGGRANDVQSLRVTALSDDHLISGAPLFFTAMAMPGPPCCLQSASSLQQEGETGKILGDSLVVFVKDEFGNGVPDYKIQYKVRTGGGSANSADSCEVQTNKDGRTGVAFVLGLYEGTGNQSVWVEAPALQGSPVVFTITAFDTLAPRQPDSVKVR